MEKRILQSIYTSIDEINEQLDPADQLSKSEETIIFGSESKLDSLGLINLITSIEINIEDDFDVTITLADERALSQESTPFKSVKSLTNYINILLEESISDK